ncbi:MAG: hypothetical protein V1854_06305 [Methanobacteriota archaeon]
MSDRDKELECKDLLVLTEDYKSEEVINWFGISEKVKCSDGELCY